MKSKVVYKMALQEYEFQRFTRAKLLNSLAFIIEQAERPDNTKVYFITEDIGHGNRNKGIVIQDISALNGMSIKLGTDFNPEYMLNGMEAVTQDEYEGYCMSVLTTHDLYSATIPDLSELMFRIMMLESQAATT